MNLGYATDTSEKLVNGMPKIKTSMYKYLGSDEDYAALQKSQGGRVAANPANTSLWELVALDEAINCTGTKAKRG